jgi:hypothetical protein
MPTQLSSLPHTNSVTKPRSSSLDISLVCLIVSRKLRCLNCTPVMSLCATKLSQV